VVEEKTKPEAHGEDALPRVDFATFVLSLSHSALMHLGEAPNPETGKVEKNLMLARQTIDLDGLGQTRSNRPRKLAEKSAEQLLFVGTDHAHAIGSRQRGRLHCNAAAD